MVQVQPVVHWQHAIQHLVVINYVVRNLSIGQHKGYSIIPGLFVFRAVDCYFGWYMQLDLIHIDLRLCYLL